jgi:hypothetical protein
MKWKITGLNDETGIADEAGDNEVEEFSWAQDSKATKDQLSAFG